MNISTTEDRHRPKFVHISVILLVALAAGVLSGIWLQNNRVKTSDVQATVLEPAKGISDFTLTTHLGEPFTLESLREKWSFLFFGYTHCPDVCPTTLHTMKQVVKAIAEKQEHGANVQVVFVSIDPERDTVERLAQYVPYFDKSFIGVTGEQGNINELTKQLGVLHLRVEAEGDAGYLMDHTASVLLLNPSGELRAVFSAPHEARQIAEDFQLITIM